MATVPLPVGQVSEWFAFGCVCPPRILLAKPGRYKHSVLKATRHSCSQKPHCERFGFVVDYSRTRVQRRYSSWTHVTQRNDRHLFCLLGLVEDSLPVRNCFGTPDFAHLVEDGTVFFFFANDSRPTKSKGIPQQELSGVAQELAPKMCPQIWATTDHA